MKSSVKRVVSLRNMPVLACGITILLFVAAAGARTFYIDAVAGDDLHAGTAPASAWKTLSKVNATTFAPGDTIRFRGGQTWTGRLAPRGSGSEAAPVVWTSWGEGRPHISAGGADETVMLRDCENILFEKFKISNPASSPHRKARGIVLYADADRAFSNITIRDNVFTDIIGDSRQQTRWLNGSIFTDSRNTGFFRNLLIEDNTITDVTVRGITGNQGAVNWHDPARMHDNVVIRGNYIDNIGADAIRVIASKNVLVEHNTVYRSGANNMGMELNYIAACFPQQSINTVWQFNEIAYTANTNPAVGDEDSQAFDVDWGCGGTHLFQYNYTHHNPGGFFLFMGSIVENHQDKVGPFEGVVLRYNVSYNDGIRQPGITWTPGTLTGRIFEMHPFRGASFPIHVYNNVFVNDSVPIGIHLKDEGRYEGFILSNNIFVSPFGGHYPQQGIVYDHNLYGGHHAPSADEQALQGDPLFVGPLGGEGFEKAYGFSLDSNSPARGGARIIANNGGRDFAGTALPEDDNPDAGAFQYVASSVGLRPAHSARGVPRTAPCAPNMKFDIRGRLLGPGSAAGGVRGVPAAGVRFVLDKTGAVP